VFGFKKVFVVENANKMIKAFLKTLSLKAPKNRVQNKGKKRRCFNNTKGL